MPVVFWPKMFRLLWMFLSTLITKFKKILELFKYGLCEAVLDFSFGQTCPLKDIFRCMSLPTDKICIWALLLRRKKTKTGQKTLIFHWEICYQISHSRDTEMEWNILFHAEGAYDKITYYNPNHQLHLFSKYHPNNPFDTVEQCHFLSAHFT